MSVGDDLDSQPSTVDDFVLAWPEEAVTALGAWSQGCLIRGSLFGVANQDDNLNPEPSSTQILDVDATVFDPDGWLVVLTQTCDLVLTGTGAGQPFAICSPLLDISQHPPNKTQAINDWTVTYLAPIANVPGGGVWAVDLRVAVPVHKLALVDVTPTQGFPGEVDGLRFSDFVALRTRRPALHDALSSDLRAILNDTIQNGPNGNEDWYAQVEQIRLDIAPSRLQPDWVRIHVLCERVLTPEERALWLTCEKRVKALFAQHNVNYGGLQFDALETVSAMEYRRWVPLPIPRLKRPPFW